VQLQIPTRTGSPTRFTRSRRQAHDAVREVPTKSRLHRSGQPNTSVMAAVIALLALIDTVRTRDRKKSLPVEGRLIDAGAYAGFASTQAKWPNGFA
jgi:hypothetical protein